MSIILGLDTSSEITGWAKIEWTGTVVRYLESGTFRVIASRPLANRLHDFRGKVSDLLHNHPIPTHVAIEKSHIRFINTAVTLAKFVGMAEELSFSYGCGEALELVANKVRRLIGSKSKEQTKEIVQKKFGVETDLLDESDALAVAWASLSELRKREAKKAAEKEKRRKKCPRT